MNPDHLLVSLSSEGHAGKGFKGSDPVCAAVSALIGTTARLLESAEGVELDGRAENPGSLFFKMRNVPDRLTEWFRGVADLLLFGLSEISRNYPEAVELEIYEQEGM